MTSHGADDSEATLEKDDSVDVELREVEAGVYAALVWLNRPDVLNAMDAGLVAALARALRSADDDDRVAAILITGRGRAFSAGGDLKRYMTLQKDPIAFPRFMDEFHDTVCGIRWLRTPVVALVNGVTAAGGLELMLGCDFAYVGRSARVSDGHLNFGQMGGGGVLTMLPRAIGPARARELVFSGRALSAEQVVEWGLANRLVEDEALIDEGLKFAAEVAAKSPAAIEAAKYVINAGLANGTGFDDALRLERERNALYVLTRPDAHEGLAAFAEKRRPRFPGR